MGFAKEGADVIINGRNLEKAKAVAKEMEGLGVRTMAIGADVSSSQDVNRMVEEAVNSSGRIDILVNNAGLIHSFWRPKRSKKRVGIRCLM